MASLCFALLSPLNDAWATHRMTAQAGGGGETTPARTTRCTARLCEKQRLRLYRSILQRAPFA